MESSIPVQSVPHCQQLSTEIIPSARVAYFNWLNLFDFFEFFTRVFFHEFERRCCGVYPKTISPYRQSESRQCCGGLKTYNPNLFQCCDDGSENEPVRVSVVC